MLSFFKPYRNYIMMKRILPILFTCFTGYTFAQTPEDAIRYSWQSHSGSARIMAVGGVMGSLGGDITAPFVNPAGLGLFKTREFTFSPGFLINNNNATYRDSLSNYRKNALTLGPTGVIIGLPDVSKNQRSSALSIAVNQCANFNNHIRYSALNNYSSFSEQFAEELAKSNQSINSVLSSNSSMPYTVAPALYTYLIDTVTVNGVVQIKAAPEYLLDSGKSVMQTMDKQTRGAMYEWGFSLATNIKEKWLFGGTLVIPSLRYDSKTTFSETDPSGDTANRFGSFTYTDHYTTTGSGLGLKLGTIYRPKEYIRFGFAFHNPTLMMLTETREASMTTVLENPQKSFSASSNLFTNGQPGEYKYAYTTPWKAMISASYVFREIDNVHRQRAFISADVEYVRHSASRYRSANEEPTSAEESYYKALNAVIKDNYKGTFNFRVGGELKFSVIMFRGGFAYYSNPYKDPEFKASRMLLSGGLGYRNHGFFIDLTYVHQMKKDVDLPYRLSDRANTFSSLQQRQGNIMATFGIKF